MNKRRKRGRPKGAPTVIRSIAFREPINEYLIKKHEETLIPYNAIVNKAVEQMMLKERDNR